MPPEFSNIDRWFSEEVQVHEGALRAWLRGKFPAISDPDNIVQETMTRIWKAQANHGRIGSPKALLFTTAHNLAIDQLRRQQITRMEPLTEVEHLSVYEESPTPADATVSNQELEFLTRAIQSLPDRCRQVLTLRKIYGLSQKEIAAQLGIAEHTVEAQVANGMRRCAEYFGRLGLP